MTWTITLNLFRSRLFSYFLTLIHRLTTRTFIHSRCTKWYNILLASLSTNQEPIRCNPPRPSPPHCPNPKNNRTVHSVPLAGLQLSLAFDLLTHKTAWAVAPIIANRHKSVFLFCCVSCGIDGRVDLLIVELRKDETDVYFPSCFSAWTWLAGYALATSSESLRRREIGR